MTPDPNEERTPVLEPFRPALHFTPPHGWINDPNGLVHFNDEWHLFYQYCEPADADGMQWGHAVSRDLLHWEHLPPAIAPDRLGHIWSGSAVVDGRDTSGLFGGQPGIVALFTYWDPADRRQSQGLAYSRDGRSFTPFAGNPVIPQLRHVPGQPDEKDFRDPKVFWHAPTGRWVMAVAGGKLRIFSSPDLIRWQFESVAPDITTECPDLFELPVSGEPGRRRWVLSGGGRWYMLGAFDGRHFLPETERLPMTHGPDCYATQTWSDAPDDRRIAIAWLFNWRYDCGARPGRRIENKFPTAPWSGGCLTVPYELALRGEVLVQRPIPELAACRRETSGLPTLGEGALDFELEVDGLADLSIPAAGGGVYVLTLDPPQRRFALDRTRAGVTGIPHFAERYEAPLPIRRDGTAALRVLLDRSSLEVFAGDGEVHFSAVILPDPAGSPAIRGACRCRAARLEL